MMKRVLTLILAAALTIPAMAQEPEAPETPAKPEAIEATEAVEAPEAEAAAVAEAPAEIEKIEEVEPIEEIEGDTTNIIGRIEVIETPEQTRVSLGKNEVIIVEESGDTVIVGLGSKGISRSSIKLNTPLSLVISILFALLRSL